LVLSKDQEPSGTGGSDIRYRESTVELDESAWRHKIAETSKVAVPPAPPPIPSNGMISRPLSSPSPHSKASVTGVRVCRPEHLVITLRRQGPFHNLRQIWTPCAARVVLIPRHLARTISLRLPVEQLRVNAIAFDETVKRIAPASAARPLSTVLAIGGGTCSNCGPWGRRPWHLQRANKGHEPTEAAVVTPHSCISARPS
jgi:hypothetical protein